MNDMQEMTKQEKCRHSYIRLSRYAKSGSECFCLKQEQKPVTEEDCANCPMFRSRYIEYPIQVKEITQEPIDYTNGLHTSYIGRPVAVRVQNETYLGIFIGDLPTRTQVSYTAATEQLKVVYVDNPAMFVPALKRIVFGHESWWRILESEDDFKEITNDDIDNTWYVKLLKEMNKKEN